MQIIAGEKRGAKLMPLMGQSVRPTAQRARESIFNILHGGKFADDLDQGIILDLFAGSGALGLEALSRGAELCYAVEKSAEAVSVIKKNSQKLGYEDKMKITQGDCLSLKAWPHPPAPIVFCDPPYDQGLALPALAHMRTLGAIATGALIIIETRKTETLALPSDLICLDERRYGMAAVTFCRYH